MVYDRSQVSVWELPSLTTLHFNYRTLSTLYCSGRYFHSSPSGKLVRSVISTWLIWERETTGRLCLVYKEQSSLSPPVVWRRRYTTFNCRFSNWVHACNPFIIPFQTGKFFFCIHMVLCSNTLLLVIKFNIWFCMNHILFIFCYFILLECFLCF